MSFGHDVQREVLCYDLVREREFRDNNIGDVASDSGQDIAYIVSAWAANVNPPSKLSRCRPLGTGAVIRFPAEELMGWFIDLRGLMASAAYITLM
jgi:hypothetical protein